MERRLGRRVADAQERAHEPADPHSDDGLPALLLHRVRGRALPGRERPRLRLPARLHGVPVRLRAAPVGGVQRRLHRASASRATSRAGSRSGCCSRRRTGAGSCSATGSRRSLRWAVVAVVLTVVALAVGMNVGGGPVDLVGLYVLALLVNFCGFFWSGGIAMRFRTIQAGAAHADAGLPRPLLRARLRAARAARGLDRGGRDGEPADVPARDRPRLHRRRRAARRSARSRSRSGSASRSGRGRSSACARPRLPARRARRISPYEGRRGRAAARRPRPGRTASRPPRRAGAAPRRRRAPAGTGGRSSSRGTRRRRR